jgi:hypothetical protein
MPRLMEIIIISHNSSLSTLKIWTKGVTHDFTRKSRPVEFSMEHNIVPLLVISFTTARGFIAVAHEFHYLCL